MLLAIALALSHFWDRKYSSKMLNREAVVEYMTFPMLAIFSFQVPLLALSVFMGFSYEGKFVFQPKGSLQHMLIVSYAFVTSEHQSLFSQVA